MRLCHLDEIADGAARSFPLPEAAGRKVIVVRRGGRVFGWLDACPHYVGGPPMAWKTDAYLDAARTHLTCFGHGARFDIETGDCVSGPCLGQALTAVAVRVDQTGHVALA